MRTERSFRRYLLRAYALAAYGAFVAATLWAVGFLADLKVVPVTVDGPSRGPAWESLLVDAALLGIFAVQHTVMARDGFKRRLARALPPAAERSTFVLASGAALLLLLWQYRSVSGTVWRVSALPWAGVLWAAYSLGWLIALAATFMIDHAGFLGLREAGWAPAAAPEGTDSLSERWLYRWVRHPMMSGLVLAFWATPDMTAGHAFFAAAATGYILVGIRFEERALRRQLGGAYSEYASRVPALVPAVRPRVRPGSRGTDAPRGGLHLVSLRGKEQDS